MADASDPAATNEDVAYERSDWHVGAVGLVLLGIFLVLVIAPLALIWGYPSAVSDVSRQLRVELPVPRLQTNPPQDLANFRADEDRRLNGTYWIDRQKGIVHIPIAEAMEKLAREGIEGFPQGKP